MVVLMSNKDHSLEGIDLDGVKEVNILLNFVQGKILKWFVQDKYTTAFQIGRQQHDLPAGIAICQRKWLMAFF